MRQPDDRTFRELKEWLGLTLADGLCYAAIAAIVAMFFVRIPAVDIVLAIVGIGLSILSCPLGMKRDPELSELTNVVKLVSYPILLAFLLLAVAAHYLLFPS